LPALLVFTVYAAAQPSGTGFTTLHDFKGTPSDGANPWANLAIGASGVLYGTTFYGGSSSAGTVFSLTPPESPGGVWTEAVLYNFSFVSNGGAYGPTDLVISSAPGGYPVLYGVTEGGRGEKGGGPCCGTVFSLTPPVPGTGPAWTYKTLYRFNNADGYGPKGVAFGNDGVLYGATAFGGASNNGTVFSLTPPATSQEPWTETVLYSFTGGSDGGDPFSGVAVGQGPGGQTVLYGTTAHGGINGNGTVFSLTPPAASGGPWTETVLHAFTGGADGIGPGAGVAIGQNGSLYGTTYFGGAGPCTAPESPGCGTVYALKPPASPDGAWIETVLYSFMYTDGSNPRAGVALQSAPGGEVLYGTTSEGGIHSCVGLSGCGTVFSLTPPASGTGALWTDTVLHYFTGNSDGSGPSAGIMIGTGPGGHTTLYGTAYAGTSQHDGTVFQLTP
jgi:uncharacterized repeat protein (TIGR03803 family)